MATNNPFIPSPALVEKRKRRTFGGAMKQAVLAIGRSWRAYLTYKRLARLSDQGLAERGLQRQDIARRAFVDDLD